jgi:hypothetical protein
VIPGRDTGTHGDQFKQTINGDLVNTFVRLQPGHPALDFGVVSFTHFYGVLPKLDGTGSKTNPVDAVEIDQGTTANPHEARGVESLHDGGEGTLDRKALLLGLQVGVVTVGFDELYVRNWDFDVTGSLP